MKWSIDENDCHERHKCTDDGLYHMDEIHFHMDEFDHTNAIYKWIQHDESNFIHGWTWTSSMWLPHGQLHLLCNQPQELS